MAITGGTRIFSKTNIPVIPYDKGTLGCWVQLNGGPKLLSNRHVMPIRGQGVWLVNPGSAGNKSAAPIAAVTHLSKVTDAALAHPSTTTGLLHVTKRIEGFGDYTGFGTAMPGMVVEGYGAETGRFTAVLGAACQHNSPSLKITVNAMLIQLDNGIKIRTGDSGSPVIDSATGNIVGLLVGSSSQQGDKMVIMDEIVASLNIAPL